jgi:hypothetical protein
VDRKLRTLYLADVAAFTLYLFGSSVNSTPIIWTAIATGLPLSCYLTAKVPTKKQIEDTKTQQLLELQNQLAKLTDEKSWTDDLNQSQVQKALAEKLDLEQELKGQIEFLKTEHENELTRIETDFRELIAKHDRELVTTKTDYSAMISEIEQGKAEAIATAKAEKEQAIAKLQSEYSEIVSQLSQNLELAVSTIEETKAKADQKMLEAQKLVEETNEIRQQLRYQSEQQELARKELSVEERRIHVELTNERALLQKQIDDGLVDNQKLKNIIEMLEVRISELTEQVNEYHLMLFSEKCDDNYTVKMVQKLLLESDINTELLHFEEKQDGKIVVIQLRPLSTFSEPKLKTVVDQLPGFLNIVRKPTFSTGKGRIEIRIDKRSDKEKALANREKLENSLISIDDCVQKNLGFLVIGEPGSAKSTGALYIANAIINQELSQKGKDDLIEPDSAMLLAFDIHHSTSWDDAGIKVIDNPLEIYQQFKYLQQEYDNRKPGNKTNRLIIFFDEMAETLDRIQVAVTELEGKKTAGNDAVSYIQNLYRSFGTGGRKKYINFIGMNHSYNVKALGIDGYYRNCFVSILLNDACRHYVNTTTKHLPEGKKEQFYDWLELMSNRYTALATGAIDDRLLKHPTHHDYPQIKDGNPPKNLQVIKQLPLDIKLVS